MVSIRCVNVDSKSSLRVWSAGRWCNGGAGNGVEDSSSSDSLHGVSRLH